MTIAQQAPRPTIVDTFVRRSAVSDALLIAGGTALVTLLAQVSVPLWPVPITGQTLGALLVGATLGSARGAASLGLYLVLGVAGVPIFSGWSGGFATVTGGTFGYIVGFVFAAALMGAFSERQWDRRPAPSALAFLASSLVPYLFGLPWLALYLSHALPADQVAEATIVNGFLVFVIGDAIKWLIAASVMPIAWRLRRR